MKLIVLQIKSKDSFVTIEDTYILNPSFLNTGSSWGLLLGAMYSNIRLFHSV